MPAKYNFRQASPSYRTKKNEKNHIHAIATPRPHTHIELEGGRAEPLSLSPGVTVFSAQYEVSSDHYHHTWMPRTRKANASR